MRAVFLFLFFTSVLAIHNAYPNDCLKELREISQRAWDGKKIFEVPPSRRNMKIKIGFLFSPHFAHEGIPQINWFGFSSERKKRIIDSLDGSKIRTPQEFREGLKKLIKKNDVIAILAHGNPYEMAVNDQLSITAKDIALVAGAEHKPLLLIVCGAGICSMNTSQAEEFETTAGPLDLNRQIAVQLIKRGGFKTVVAPNRTIQNVIDWRATIGMFGLLPNGVRSSFKPDDTGWVIFEKSLPHAH